MPTVPLTPRRVPPVLGDVVLAGLAWAITAAHVEMPGALNPVPAPVAASETQGYAGQFLVATDALAHSALARTVIYIR